MSTGVLELTAAELVLGLVNPGELPARATQALESGRESPSLAVVAGLHATEGEEARLRFERALAELGIAMPSAEDAVMLLVRDIAAGIVAGHVAPSDGARRIWDLTLAHPGGALSELDTFVYAASEWDDRPDFRAELERGIVAAARDLAA